MSNEKPAPQGQQRRTVRSFVLRTGRMTSSQKLAYETLWSEYGLQADQGPLKLAALFGREAPMVLEIGFGMGDSLVQMAKAQPQLCFIGVEVHRPGVGRLMREAKEQGLDNIRVFAEDALLVLEKAIPDHALQRVQLFFPDPWPKKKHHKRRIVQPEFLALVRRKLKAGGQFHAATDWQPYAEHMLEQLTQAPGWKNLDQAGGYSPKPEYRPGTKFEARGQKLGHGVWDLLFEAVD